MRNPIRLQFFWTHAHPSSSQEIIFGLSLCDDLLKKGPSGMYYNIHYPRKLVKKMTNSEKDDLFGRKGKSGGRVTVNEAKRQSSAAKSWLEKLEKRSNQI